MDNTTLFVLGLVGIAAAGAIGYSIGRGPVRVAPPPGAPLPTPQAPIPQAPTANPREAYELFTTSTGRSRPYQYSVDHGAVWDRFLSQG